MIAILVIYIYYKRILINHIIWHCQKCDEHGKLCQCIVSALAYLKELFPYVNSCGYLKYSRMRVACGGLQNLHIHNWGVDSSFVWYIISAVAALHCLALAEQEDRRELAPKDLWPLEWLVAFVDGCIDTRG